MSKALLLVMMDQDDSIDENEFNEWYNSIHLPERLACPGFVAARRFVAVEGQPRYLALYELDSLDALTSQPWHARVTRVSENATELDRRMMAGHRNVTRNVYVEILSRTLAQTTNDGPCTRSGVDE
jgi:hypothetical protein